MARGSPQALEVTAGIHESGSPLFVCFVAGFARSYSAAIVTAWLGCGAVLLRGKVLCET